MSLFDNLSSKNKPATEADYSRLDGTGLVDFHSHILPGMDDGSDSVETTLAMLAEMKKQNITRVVATPHFYPDDDDPQKFLARRSDAVERLLLGCGESDALPPIYLGAEVAYYTGIGKSDALPKLTIAGTPYILIEMPFGPWNSFILNDLFSVASSGFRPVLAHIERYLPCIDRKIWEQLAVYDILIQSNAEFFLGKRMSKRALGMLDAGVISLIGSDAHNLSSRPPRVGDAALVILDALGKPALENIASATDMILRDTKPINR